MSRPPRPNPHISSKASTPSSTRPAFVPQLKIPKKHTPQPSHRPSGGGVHTHTPNAPIANPQYESRSARGAPRRAHTADGALSRQMRIAIDQSLDVIFLSVGSRTARPDISSMSGDPQPPTGPRPPSKGMSHGINHTHRRVMKVPSSTNKQPSPHPHSQPQQPLSTPQSHPTSTPSPSSSHHPPNSLVGESDGRPPSRASSRCGSRDGTRSRPSSRGQVRHIHLLTPLPNNYCRHKVGEVGVDGTSPNRQIQRRCHRGVLLPPTSLYSLTRV